jgi:uncharacterized protein
MKPRLLICMVLWIVVSVCSGAQERTGQPTVVAEEGVVKFPVIDVHFHAPLEPGPVDHFVPKFNQYLSAMDSLDVRIAVLNGVPDVLYDWQARAPKRLIPALLFPCENGIATNWGRPCFANGKEFPDIDWLRSEVKAGRIKALGEITAQYMGIAPDDSRLEPYFALAEEFDIPVFIHMGLGPPNAAYESSPATVKSPHFSAAAGNPLRLEPVLERHRKLRIAVMHAGWPYWEEMTLMLHLNPNLYADVGVLQSAIPRRAYYSYLRQLVEAGYASRIMFGTDGSPKQIQEGIEAITRADFLDPQQKGDILCGNAARFLQLPQSTCSIPSGSKLLPR